MGGAGGDVGGAGESGDGEGRVVGAAGGAAAELSVEVVAPAADGGVDHQGARVGGARGDPDGAEQLGVVHGDRERTRRFVPRSVDRGAGHLGVTQREPARTRSAHDRHHPIDHVHRSGAPTHRRTAEVLGVHRQRRRHAQHRRRLVSDGHDERTGRFVAGGVDRGAGHLGVAQGEPAGGRNAGDRERAVHVVDRGGRPRHVGTGGVGRRRGDAGRQGEHRRSEVGERNRHDERTVRDVAGSVDRGAADRGVAERELNRRRRAVHGHRAVDRVHRRGGEGDRGARGGRGRCDDVGGQREHGRRHVCDGHRERSRRLVPRSIDRGAGHLRVAEREGARGRGALHVDSTVDGVGGRRVPGHRRAVGPGRRCADPHGQGQHGSVDVSVRDGHGEAPRRLVAGGIGRAARHLGRAEREQARFGTAAPPPVRRPRRWPWQPM